MVMLTLGYVLSLYNYLLFHVIVEFFAIVVAILVFILGTRTYKHSENNFLLVLGVGYFYVAIIDFFHTMTYKGMGIFAGITANEPTQLWIAGRYLESLVIVVAIFCISKKADTRWLHLAGIALSGFVVHQILVVNAFPDCFIPGVGLTAFKVASEYAICLILAWAILRISKSSIRNHTRMYRFIMASLILTIASELSFTLYNDVYGFMNFVGHVLKGLSYYMIFESIVVRGLTEPYDMISGKLKNIANNDYLTGICNRYCFFNSIERMETEKVNEKSYTGIVLIDLDNFKHVNDTYGHILGDKLLKNFAGKLMENVRDEDIVCRFGGDEFIIYTVQECKENIEHLFVRLMGISNSFSKLDERFEGINFSMGLSISSPSKPKSVRELIKEADDKMYKEKGRRIARRRREVEEVH